ncbi:MAG: Gfo/Idh/MocA family oxidoreductase [Bryobacterales bacterium]|nr:Gfo/Idh/MocA family oxidoreductase [Bryobacterales bacterium]
MNGYRFPRRHFFFGPLLTAAVPAGGFGSTASLSRLGYKSPNEKLNVGAVGIGIRGPAILSGAAATENIVALCDVDEARSARGFAEYPRAKKYKDYRKMFEAEGKGMDAVMIATPDHMHTPIALLAMQQGKHVYCEKPLTRTAWESQLLADAAVKYKVATQMGNQGWSHEGTKTACEILWSGEIGEVKELHSWTGGIYGGQPNIPATGPAATAVPPTLDWDLWLGCAESRSFNPLMTNQWRAFIDFSTGGSLGDWLVHNLGPAHLALQLDKASPISVECVFVEGKSEWLWPLRAHVVFEFPARAGMPPLTVHTYQNMRGDFENPPGMGEDERLFPPMNNLSEKGRPFVQGGDGMMLVSTQLTVDGKPIQQQRPPQFPQGARRPGSPGGPPLPPGVSSDPKMRAPGNGAILVGSKGHMATSARGEGVWLLPASRWAEYKLPSQMLPRGVNHQQDWIRACKGGAPGMSDFSVATKYIEWLALGAIALRVPGKLLWDKDKRRFSNSEAANRYLKPELRKGWDLKL